MSFPPPSPKQARLIWFALSALAIAVLVALLVALIWGLGHVLQLLSPVLWPLAVAGATAYLLDPVVDFIQRRGVPRTRAILCVFALAVVLITALFVSVVPQLVRETRELAAKVPGYSRRVQDRIQEWVSHPPALLRKFLKLAGDSGSPTNTVVDTHPVTGSTSTIAPSAIQPGDPASPLWSKALDSQALQSATQWLA